MSERPVAPPGWPAEVRPPGAPDWERTAVVWLYDHCPADYRAHEVLRRHPVVLARFAVGHLRSAVETAKSGLGTARADLRDVVPPEVIDAAIATYEREGGRLASVLRAAELVEQALRGRRYAPRL